MPSEQIGHCGASAGIGRRGAQRPAAVAARRSLRRRPRSQQPVDSARTGESEQFTLATAARAIARSGCGSRPPERAESRGSRSRRSRRFRLQREQLRRKRWQRKQQQQQPFAITAQFRPDAHFSVVAQRQSPLCIRCGFPQSRTLDSSK